MGYAFLLDVFIGLVGKIYSSCPTDPALISSLAVASAFEEFCRFEGFGQHKPLGKLGAGTKVWGKEKLTDLVVGQLDMITLALKAKYGGVDANNFAPYVSENGLPNVFSPLHLIVQSICHEHVCLQWNSANV